MIETSQALAALKDANPAIDERALSDTAWSTSDLLQEVARRTDMQTRELKHVEPVKTSPPPIRSRGPLVALVTAAAVIVIGAVFALASLTGDRNEPEPATTLPPPTTVAATTTAPPAPTTAAPTTTGAPEVPVWLGRADPGTYQPVRFGVPFAFTVADGGWESGVDSETLFAICGPDVDGPVGARSACFRASAVALFLLGHDTVEDTEAYLATFPGAALTDVSPISIDGAAGIRFSYNNSLSPHSGLEGGYGGYPYWIHEVQEIPLGADRAIVSIVDVDGTIVTAIYQGRAIAEPTDFDTNLAEGMAIVDSIVWGD